MRKQRIRELKKYRYYNFILSLIFVFSLGTLGIGYAAWNDILYLNGTMTTGYIRPVFTDVQLILNSGKGCGNAIVSEDGTKLLVSIDDAQPGDVYFLRFQVENRGTVPVKANTITATAGEALEIKMIHEPAGIIERQSSTRGEIRIKVRSVSDDCTNTFIVQLPFSQVAAL